MVNILTNAKYFVLLLFIMLFFALAEGSYSQENLRNASEGVNKGLKEGLKEDKKLKDKGSNKAIENKKEEGKERKVDKYKGKKKIYIEREKEEVYDDPLPGRKFPSILGPDKGEYRESKFRRFDIIFFLAYPVFVAYQYLINEVVSRNYAINEQSKGRFSRNQNLYMFLSSVILGIAVAYEDYKAVWNDKDPIGLHNTNEGSLITEESNFSIVLLQIDF